jgi:hypothetical protein
MTVRDGEVATEAHAGQVDRAGEPYIGHRRGPLEIGSELPQPRASHPDRGRGLERQQLGAAHRPGPRHRRGP